MNIEPRDSSSNNRVQLAKAAETVSTNGAKAVYAIVTHGILSGKAIETINASCLAGLVVTNSKTFSHTKPKFVY
jgi:phosphoribosylpyrophosphate synthetase